MKMLWGFVGLTGSYCRFVKDYRKIASPFTNLLRKDQFNWNDEADHAFQILKKAMISTPVFALPNFTKMFVIECDASSTSIAAVLMQEPLAFF